MRKVNQTIKDIISSIEALKGHPIKVQVSHGRKKIEKLVGTIENMYPSVLVIILIFAP